MSTAFEDLILRDITANRPAAGKPGRLFFDTTLVKMQRDNGSSWDDVESTGTYTDEKAQDAIGAMIADTDTLDLTYTDATPELKGDVKKQMSITSDSSGLKLSGDAASPGNNQVYGTDGSGVKGWKADPAGGGVTMDQADPYGIHHRISGSNGDDDEFSTDTSANYTEVDPTGTTTWLLGTSHVASCVFNGQASADYGALLKAMTLANGEWFETYVKVMGKVADYTGVGILVTDGTSNTSNAISGQILHSSGATLGESYKGTITNMSTVIASTSLFGREVFAGIRIRLKRISSTSFQVSFSTPDGAQFDTFSLAAGDPGFTPTHAGLFVTVYGGSHKGIASFDFIRHMS